MPVQKDIKLTCYSRTNLVVKMKSLKCQETTDPLLHPHSIHPGHCESNNTVTDEQAGEKKCGDVPDNF